MDRQFGLPSEEAATAAGQLQKHYPPAKTQPLPAGGPGRATAEQLGIKESDTFVVIGDHGGVKAPGPQNAVSYAIQDLMHSDNGYEPSFIYTVGDIVYFNGDPGQYEVQFYEPYAHASLPIVGIPGNHDGNVAVDDAGNPTGRQPLDTFMANFCSKTPEAPACDPQLEYGRHTQTQPWCDWTLELRVLTIIGLYSNVVSGGHFEQSQIDWLAQELKEAPADRPVAITVHHPPFSVDAHHGGAKRVWEVILGAIQTSGREPDLILSGHVHDYQRFSVALPSGKKIPVVVIGNSGYHNLHQLASDAEAGLDVLGDGSVIFENGDASEYGFLRLTVAGGKITGAYNAVTPGTMPDGSDAELSEDKDTF